MLPGNNCLDSEHSLFSDYGLDLAQSSIPDTVSTIHHTVRDLRLGLQDTRQHRTIGQLFAAYNYRLDGIDKVMDSVAIKRSSQKFIIMGDRSMVIVDWRW